MNKIERRQYPRTKAIIGVTVFNRDEKIRAIMFDIGNGGIGIFADREIAPGTEVGISMNYIDDCALKGTVRSADLAYVDSRYRYRLGIEADQMLVPEDIWKKVYPGRAI